MDVGQKYRGATANWNAITKRLRACIRVNTPLSLSDARRVVTDYVDKYNNARLHSAIGYVTPADKLHGRAETILTQRDAKLVAAREARKAQRKAS